MRISRLLPAAAFAAGLGGVFAVCGPTPAADDKADKKAAREAIVSQIKNLVDTPAERKAVAAQLKAAKTQAEREAIVAKLKAAKAAKPTPAVAAKPAAAPAQPPANAVAAKTPAPLPTPAKPAPPRAVKPVDPAALARVIDEHVDRKLAAEKVAASPACSDEEFVRRVYLDITGVVPSAAQTRAFLDGTAADKRAKLVDELLASPLYGRRLSDVWTAKLYPKDSANRFVLKQPFAEWLEAEFNKNTPWDRFVTNIVSASGTVEDNPAVTFFLANRSIDKLTDHVGNQFLCVQLQCAQCHNHPFVSEWKQNDYWHLAAFFSRVQPQNPRNANKGGDNTKIGVQDGKTKTRLKDFFPEAAKDLPPKPFLADAVDMSGSESYRVALARWLTSADNPYFAKAMVNRTWAALFGRGFVNPIEDMGPSNDASHPELLDALAHAFADGGFDTKGLYKAICLSRAYQRTSRPVGGNEADEELFSHQTVKVMTPEQLFDSLDRVVGGLRGKDAVRGGGGQGRGAVGPRDRFVEFFLAGAEEPNQSEYEAGIPQALRLMNNRLLTGGTAALKDFAKPGAAPAQVIESMYLAALSRRPTPAETAALTQYVSRAATTAEGYGDVLWAVLNSTEFMTVR